MAEMLLINPRRRRKAKASARRTHAKRRRVTTHRRRRNPIAAASPAVTRRVRRVMKRRANPVGRVHHRRRRRNPIGGSSRTTVNNVMAMFKDAAVGGAGALAVDALMGWLNPKLPASLQVSPTGVGVGDAVKAVGTVFLGNALSKHTNGLSKKMALGALTCQARDLISGFLPDSMALAGLGYNTPAAAVRMSNRIGPNRLNRYTAPGKTPLLSAYTQPGTASPLLNGAGSVAAREGFRFR